MKFKHIAIISLDVLCILALTGCGDQISDVINALLGSANAAISDANQGLVEHGVPSADAFNMVGSAGGLSQHQVTTLLHLNWPQSHQAIEGALGLPHTRDTYTDYYTMPNGHTVAIYYSGGNATGYSLGDSGNE